MKKLAIAFAAIAAFSAPALAADMPVRAPVYQPPAPVYNWTGFWISGGGGGGLWNADSNVVAALLGNITLAGVNPAANNSTTFGVAFRTSAGAGARGGVKANGSAIALTPPASIGKFNYLGLSG